MGRIWRGRLLLVHTMLWFTLEAKNGDTPMPCSLEKIEKSKGVLHRWRRYWSLKCHRPLKTLRGVDWDPPWVYCQTVVAPLWIWVLAWVQNYWQPREVSLSSGFGYGLVEWYNPQESRLCSSPPAIEDVVCLPWIAFCLFNLWKVLSIWVITRKCTGVVV